MIAAMAPTPARQRPTYAEAARTLLRDTLLDAAGDLMRERGWAEVTMADVAAAAGVSRQTLFRQLKAEGTTFEEVLDELRQKLAVNYLGAARASVKETARQLGYADATAFSRAFKRWTGQSPREYVVRSGSSG